MMVKCCQKTNRQNPCKNGDSITMSKIDLTESDDENVVNLRKNKV